MTERSKENKQNGKKMKICNVRTHRVIRTFFLESEVQDPERTNEISGIDTRETQILKRFKYN